jgi:hypothetical protein
MKIRVSIIGSDKRYYENLEEEYDFMYAKIHQLEFKIMDFNKDKNHVILFDQIVVDNPHLIYLDFSSNFNEAMRLLSLLLAYQQKTELTIIGLFPQIDISKTRNLQMKQIMEAGLLVNHVKSGIDYSGPIFNAFSIRFPAQAVMPKFSEVTSKEGIPTKLLERSLISSFSFEYIELESNLNIETDTTVEIQTGIGVDVFPSIMYQLSFTSSKDLFSRKRYKHTYTPLFEDPIILPEATNKMAKAHAQDKIELRDKDIEEKHKPSYQAWLDERLPKSSPKLVKIAIIDRSLTFLKERLDKSQENKISVRVWEQATLNEDSISRYTPKIVVYHLESAPEIPESEEAPVLKAPTPTQLIEQNEHKITYNDQSVLKNILTQVTSDGDAPYFIILGDLMNSESRRKDLGYTNLISYPNEISIDLIIKIANAYSANKKAALQKAFENKFIPAEETAEGQSTIMLDIKIMHISEYTVDFQCDEEVPNYTTFELESPIKLSLFVIPKGDRHRHAHDKNIYTALIHSLEESEIKNLRQYLINKKK